MNQRFELWTPLHLFIVLMTLALCLLFIAWSRKTDAEAARKLGKWIGIILILNYFAYVIYRISTGHWQIRYDLPMELCNWSMIASAIALLTHNRTAAELSYFWVMGGSINGVITPDLPVTFPHVYFFIFFIAHSGLVIAAMYIVAGLKLAPRPGAVWRAFLFSELYFVSAYVISLLLNSNYGYTTAKPAGGSAMNFLPEWPYYLLYMQIIGLLVFFLLYLPFYYRHRTAESQSL